MQATALWVKNTNFAEEQPFCFAGLMLNVEQLNITLFQNRTVFEILWGYTDPLLTLVMEASSDCPTPDGLTDFVQLQVRKILGFTWVGGGGGASHGCLNLRLPVPFQSVSCPPSPVSTSFSNSITKCHAVL